MREEIKVHVVDYGRKNLYMRYSDPITGKQVTRSTKTNHKKEAAKVAAKWEAELQEGRYKSVSKVTWSEFKERYETEHLPSLAPDTGDKVAAVFSSIQKILHPNKLVSLNSERISYYQNQLRKMGRSEQTIKSHSQHLKAALNWAKSMGMLYEVPEIKMPARAKIAKMMKGRPITGEEFDRMLMSVNDVILNDDERKSIEKPELHPRVSSWKHLLQGLYWSGLRMGEAMNLTWDDSEKLQIDLTGEHPMMLIPADLEKGNRDRLLPIAPEFAEMILTTPQEERTGYFFNPLPIQKFFKRRVHADLASRYISQMGRKAGIKVSEKNGKVKFASAHDLRRSFGERWSTRVPSQILMQMMRHEDIKTTLKYYVGRNAETTSRAIYSAMPEAQSGNTLGNTSATE